MEMGYVSESIRAPRLRGRTLLAFVRLLENPLTAALLAPSLIHNLGVSKLRAATIDEEPTPSPRHDHPGSFGNTRQRDPEALPLVRGVQPRAFPFVFN